MKSSVSTSTISPPHGSRRPSFACFLSHRRQRCHERTHSDRDPRDGLHGRLQGQKRRRGARGRADRQRADDRRHARKPSPRRSARSAASCLARDTHASLSAPAPGRVGQVLVATGQSVRQGQPLVELDQAPFQATLRRRSSRVHGGGTLKRTTATSRERGHRSAERRRGGRGRDGAHTRRRRRGAARGATLRHPVAHQRCRDAHDGDPRRVRRSGAGARRDRGSDVVRHPDERDADGCRRVRRGAKVRLSTGSTSAGESLGIGTVVDIGATIDSSYARCGNSRSGGDDSAAGEDRRDDLR